MQAEDIRRLAGNLKTRDSLIIEGWDIGGQPIFAILHHLYMTRYSFFCELFDMRQLVPDAERRFPDAFPDVPHGVSPRKHALAALRFWLNSNVVHTAVRNRKTTAHRSSWLAPTKTLSSRRRTTCRFPASARHVRFHPAWQAAAQPHADGGQKNMLWFFLIDNRLAMQTSCSACLAVIEKAIREEKYVHKVFRSPGTVCT